jgi:hypothetical protein
VCSKFSRLLAGEARTAAGKLRPLVARLASQEWSYLEWAKLIATSLAISTVTTAIDVALWLWFLK